MVVQNVSTQLIKGINRALTAAMLLAVASCASGEWDQVRDIQPNIVKGLDSVKHYYVDPVRIQPLALAGLETVLNHDDRVGMRPTLQKLVVTYDDRTIGEHAWPQTDVPAIWAYFTVGILQQARDHSTPLSELTTSDILESYFYGMSLGLDSFTRYSSPEQAREQRESRDGFGGVGLSLELHEDSFRISAISDDGPAADTDVDIGDILLSIDDAGIADWNLAQVTRALHGRIGTVVDLKLARSDRSGTYNIALRRTKIIPNTVTLAQDGDVPVISIGRFNKTTAKRVASLLDRIGNERSNGLSGLVLDLRGNPGGLLDEAVETADLFLDRGVIAITEGRHPQSDQRFDAESGDMLPDIPIVVLIDGGTASAAEILAAALQDHRRAVVVGSVSYGKGTVQKVLTMPNSGELALTWARYLTPLEYAIHDFGILPTICTSNFENGVAAVLKTLRKSPWQADQRFRYLRTLQYQGTDTVKEFRASCPWNGQSPHGIDIDAAQALLLDRELYDDALDLGNKVYAIR